METSTAYTSGQSTTGTNEETSTDRTTDGDHVKMARLHGLVELDQTALVGTTLEGLHVQTVAGHEVLTVTPVSNIFALTLNGWVRDAGLLIRRESLLVVHDGRLDRSVLGMGKTGEDDRDPGSGCSYEDMDQREGEAIDIYPVQVGDGPHGTGDRDPRRLMHKAHEPGAWHRSWHPSITVEGQADD